MNRHIVTLLIITFLAFGFVSCGKTGQTGPEGKPGNPKAEKKAGGDEKIDIDKLDLPPRMKKAIKEGKIPMSRVKEMLARRKGKQGAPTVRIARVERKPIHSYLILNGTVEPERKVEVFSRLSAYVNRLASEEGDLVKEGQLLAHLDDTEIRISYQQAKIQLDQAKLTLDEELNNHTRNQELKKNNLISEQMFQASQATYRKAKLEYENKLENFKNLKLQLDYTRITAPVGGFVTERLVEVGSKVNANQQVFTVEDFNPLLIKVYVPTSDIVNLKKGMIAAINTDILKGMTFEGTVKLINPRIDVQSGTVKVTIEVFDKAMRLKPGMFVEVKIMVSDKDDALVIPRKSVQYKQNIPYVFVFKRGEVSRRDIVTGITEGDDIEVLEGIDDGEAIVTVGVETLKDNMKVNVAR
jgi:RND family efflux transporter MFP subunit